ncbi:MAG: hypothetical protein K8W52_05090 [Deltaproteobacteria bacterium]|nr:hypothetical protein [Deltaproteobacteria bacterium]
MGLWDDLTANVPSVDLGGTARSLYSGASDLVDRGVGAATDAGRYLHDGAVELGHDAYGLGERAVQGVSDTADAAYHGLTDWHFEGRQARNGAAPSDAELGDPSRGWELLPPSMSVFHDDGHGAPERKYVNGDGRESVRDGDTGTEVTDPRYMATYNYVTPMAWDNAHGVSGVAEWAARGIGHIGADVLPYLLGGNVRGPG